MTLIPRASPTLVKRRFTPLNFGKGRAQHVVAEAQFARDRHHGQRVLYVVPAEHGQRRGRRLVRVAWLAAVR